MKRLVAAAAAIALLESTAAAQQRSNAFGDPFVQATGGLHGCPVPLGPLYSADEARAEAHGRTERGTTCYLSGWCRLPNAYLYDKEIIPRVQRHIVADGRFGASAHRASGSSASGAGCICRAALRRARWPMSWCS